MSTSAAVDNACEWTGCGPRTVVRRSKKAQEAAARREKRRNETEDEPAARRLCGSHGLVAGAAAEGV